MKRKRLFVHISGHTRLLGLIGTPVDHSKSPQMYNYCFQKFNQDFAYFAFDVNADNVEKALHSLKTLNFRGANVTMPLKNAVIPFLDKVSPAAKAVGSVNTIVNDDVSLPATLRTAQAIRSILKPAVCR